MVRDGDKWKPSISAPMVNGEVTQCAFFDGSTSTAKLMGVEYFISTHLALKPYRRRINLYGTATCMR
jgi:hypothetical protein